MSFKDTGNPEQVEPNHSARINKKSIESSSSRRKEISNNPEAINSQVSFKNIGWRRAKIILGTIIALSVINISRAAPIKTTDLVISDDFGQILQPSKVVPTRSFSSDAPSITEAPPLLQKLGHEFTEKNNTDLAIPTGSDVDDPVPTGDSPSSSVIKEVSNKNISDIPGMSEEAKLLVQNSMECLSRVKSENLTSLSGDPKVEANRKRLLDDPELAKCLNPLFKDQKLMKEVELRIENISQNPEMAENFRRIAGHKDLLDFMKRGIQEYKQINQDNNQLIKRSDNETCEVTYQEKRLWETYLTVQKCCSIQNKTDCRIIRDYNEKADKVSQASEYAIIAVVVAVVIIGGGGILLLL